MTHKRPSFFLHPNAAGPRLALPGCHQHRFLRPACSSNLSPQWRNPKEADLEREVVVYHRCLGRSAVPMTRQPLVLQLEQPLKEVYVAVSMAE
ncbi:MAG: hypothetical protein WBW48_04635 [Anaerolineae bacterium]